jgi:hypothetical protein
MAESSYPWGVDATDAAAADSRLYQTGWRELVGSAIGSGVVFDRSNGTATSVPLYVTAGATNTTISVGVGSAVVQGFLYDNTSAKVIDVATVGTQPSAGQSRTDSVILKLDPAASPASTRLSVQLKAGTPATTGSQVAPTLTQSPTGTWEIEIARVTRAAASNVLQANVTQLQPRPVFGTQSTNAPSNPVVGQEWFDSSFAHQIWTGTAWKRVGGGMPIICGAWSNTTPSIPTNSLTVISFTQEYVDTGNMHSTSTNTHRITCQVAGWYKVWGVVAFDSQTGGTRGGLIRYNPGSSVVDPTYTHVAATNFNTTVNLVPAVIQMAVGDYIQLEAYQNSGVSVPLTTTAGMKTSLFAEYIGS